MPRGRMPHRGRPPSASPWPPVSRPTPRPPPKLPPPPRPAPRAGRPETRSRRGEGHSAPRAIDDARRAHARWAFFVPSVGRAGPGPARAPARPASSTSQEHRPGRGVFARQEARLPQMSCVMPREGRATQQAPPLWAGGSRHAGVPASGIGVSGEGSAVVRTGPADQPPAGPGTPARAHSSCTSRDPDLRGRTTRPSAGVGHASPPWRGVAQRSAARRELPVGCTTPAHRAAVAARGAEPAHLPEVCTRDVPPTSRAEAGQARRKAAFSDSGARACSTASMLAPITAAFSAATDCTIERYSVASGVERV